MLGRATLIALLLSMASPPRIGHAHALDAPDTVRADADGLFSYEWVFRVGPGTAFLASAGWAGVESVIGGTVGDCFCDPELCTLDEGDSLTFFVSGDLTIPSRGGIVENWLSLCLAGDFSSSTTIVPWVPTPAEIVPQSSVMAILAYPNPFEGTVELSVSLDRAMDATVDVVDIRGRVIRRLWDGALPEGPTFLRWQGRDEAGRGAAAGVYFVRLAAGGVSRTKKVVFLDGK